MTTTQAIDRLIARVPQLGEFTVAPPALALLPNQPELEREVAAAVLHAPDDPRGHAMLGNLLTRRALYLPAREAYLAAIRCDAGFAAAHLAVAELSSILRDEEQAQQQLALALGMRRRYDDPLPIGGRLRVLMLLRDATYAVNMPLEMIVDRSRVALHKLYIGGEPHETLPDYDVAITAFGTKIGDEAILERAVRIAENARPINDPRALKRCSRQHLAQTLRDCENVAAVDTTLVSENEVRSIGLPSLVRPVDTQAGVGLALIEHMAELTAHVERFPSATYHVSRYVDYRSKDGYFRKYRIVIIDGVAYPYHLAISPRWMVHYLSSPMDEHQWMREEEEAFLRDPASVFTGWTEATRAIAHAVGLDYVGLDVSRLPDGPMLVFEADPAMLLHDEDERGPFAYKRPYVARIREALHALIERRASAVDAISG